MRLAQEFEFDINLCVERLIKGIGRSLLIYTNKGERNENK